LWGAYRLGEERGTQAALGSGIVTGKNASAPTYISKDVDFGLFWDVWQALQDSYVNRPLPDTKLFYSALSGLVAGAGDPYTVFMDPKIASDFNAEISGSFDGIGAEIGIRDEQLVIIAPLDGTPAALAGIKSGDAIRTIDTTDTSGMSLVDAVSRIRGQRGTTVTLVLERAGAKEPITVAVVRDTITVESVKGKMIADANGKENIAYFRITNFNEDTTADFNVTVTRLLQEAPQGVILDLRDNPGGYLDSAVAIASYWVPRGPVVIERFNGAVEKAHQASGTPLLSGVKTIVLVNAGSASASEIVAGALQDTGTATIVGTTTFGKGTVQEYRPLRDGSALKVTVAEWLTPNKHFIDKAGITPDVVVEEPREQAADDDDLVLERAKELLR